MGYRWLHRAWNIFWGTLGILAALCILIIGTGYFILQLPSTKNYIVTQIEDRFNQQEGEALLKIGRLEGNIPYNVSFVGVSVYPDSSSLHRIFHSDTISASFDLSGLLQRQLTFNSLEIHSPKIIIDPGVDEAITSISEVSSGPDSFQQILSDWTLLAPTVRIQNGTIELYNFDVEQVDLIDSDMISVTDIEFESFLNVNSSEAFLDIENLQFGVPEANLSTVNIFGQFFTDSRSLELNAFNISTQNSALKVNGNIEDFNLFDGDLFSQLEAARYDLNVDQFAITNNSIRKLIPQIPEFDQGISIQTLASGSIDSVNIDLASLRIGNSEVSFTGSLNPRNVKDYRLIFNSLEMDSTDLSVWNSSLSPAQLNRLSNALFTGTLNGENNGIQVDMLAESNFGDVSIDGFYSFTDSINTKTILLLDSLDVGEVFLDQLNQTSLSGEIVFQTDAFDLQKSTGNLLVDLNSGFINSLPYDSLNFSLNWEEGIYSPKLQLLADTSYFTSFGMLNVQDSIPSLTLSGIANEIDLKRLTNVEPLAEGVVDIQYELDVTASNLNNAFGQLTIDIPKAVIEGDTLEAHQIYADYNTENSNSKLLRITSSAFDLSLDGIYNPESLLPLTTHWTNYLEHQINEEILFNNGSNSTISFLDSLDQTFQVSFNTKNSSLLRSYFPGLPDVTSNLDFDSNINMNPERLLFTLQAIDPQLITPISELDSLALQLTGSFRYGELLKDFSDVRGQLEIGEFTTEYVEGEGVRLNMEMEEDSIHIQSNIQRLSDDAVLVFESNVSLNDTSLSVSLIDFALGNESYKWVNEGTPAFNFDKGEKLAFENFLFTNAEELLSFDGVFSSDVQDSVNYNIQNVNLQRISDILSGRVDFSGTLDGSFTSKSLTRIPSIQGELGISAFSLSDRVVGDLEVSSIYNSNLSRFDTRIEVRTDSAKYPDYFVRNKGKGQDITLEGYVIAPDGVDFSAIDSLFYFDLDFQSIDLWVLPFIAPRVFTEMSGVASGEGSIWGNFDDFDYNVDYEIGFDDAVFIQPRFLDTYYYALGEINLNREDGLVIKDMFMIDPSGGTAILSGTYDLGHFGKIHEIDLILELDEFQILNSTFDQDLAFFGDAYGSSTLNITGTNLNPVLTTLTPIRISDYSNIGIPLLEETELDEDNDFIVFVDDFDLSRSDSEIDASGDVSTENQDASDPFDRPFIERATLDLQFVTDVPMKVQLIFDPVTGDLIEADGTGRLGIRLEDQTLSMFGQFDISGGQYQFVSGEIFTRRFELEPGGSIVWEGSPEDARVDLSAFYQARPDMNTLTQARSELDSEESQRVPVQLVLEVGGSLAEIENDFYFRLPNTFELQQSSTLTTQINNLNRNEDEKLIQATSFLLMGDFIPSNSAGSDVGNTLTDNISGSGAVLNPLLSSQVISPLLSNQVNSLLRSDIGTLDIDFNLNTYNDVDLAVALRLYNDRIILSREGLITGAQSGIGDLGATYRINQTLSVTAFHRQDPTFGTISSAEETQQSQDINGLGVEAQVSFDSWNEFFRRLTNPFRRLFGKKDDNESVASGQ